MLKADFKITRDEIEMTISNSCGTWTRRMAWAWMMLSMEWYYSFDLDDGQGRLCTQREGEEGRKSESSKSLTSNAKKLD